MNLSSTLKAHHIESPNSNHHHHHSHLPHVRKPNHLSAEQLPNLLPPRPLSLSGSLIREDLSQIDLTTTTNNVNIRKTMELPVLLPQLEEDVEGNDDGRGKVDFEEVLGPFGPAH